MIHFDKVRWKNFLSTGNAFTEIQLDRTSSTLVLGENGSGKSTFLDAVTFALFNKPFRSVTKPQLINSKNAKKMLVEIEFSVGKTAYLVRRGSLPSIFQIEVDGVPLDQNANIRDFQKHLEENILKLNYKSFTQIVILGSASFTPFMQLTPAIRREIIEDILDIKIFSVMRKVLSESITALVDKQKNLDSEIKVEKERGLIQKNYVETLKADKQERLDKIIVEISTLQTDIATNQRSVDILVGKREALDGAEDKKRMFESYRQEFVRKIKEIKNEIDFYHKNDDCPTCKQGIDHAFKEATSSEKEAKILELEQAITDVDQTLLETNKIYEESKDLERQMRELNSLISSHETLVRRLQIEKTDIESKAGNIELETQRLTDIAKHITDLNNQKSVLTEDQHYNSFKDNLLKDSGIKTKIINQYLPDINRLVNHYLSAMDFFVQFELDGTFKETIKSRHRDTFTYNSFSEGEKQRIDLALVFTWRTIAKMKNSANTNLLILDEIFDSSLDINGTDYVSTLLGGMTKDTNVFVISHKGDQLFDKFRSVIKFKKKQDFSVII